jgi:hypothetical protein
MYKEGKKCSDNWKGGIYMKILYILHINLGHLRKATDNFSIIGFGPKFKPTGRFINTKKKYWMSLVKRESSNFHSKGAQFKYWLIIIIIIIIISSLVLGR